MLIGPASLLLAALLPAAIAQDTGSIEGRITSSTTHTGIGGAIVTIASQRTITDASGAFRIDGLPPGSYAISAAAPGFFNFEGKVRLDTTATAARLDAELMPHASISGRLLDDEGNPVPGVRIVVIPSVRGTGTTLYTWGATTDTVGRYEVGELRPGGYLAMAEPEPRLGTATASGHAARQRILPPPKSPEEERRVWANTYYPAAATRSQAGRLVLHAGTQLAGCDIRLVALPVHAIRGMVYKDDGDHAGDVIVNLVSAEPLSLTEAWAHTRDGAFEFRDVPAGDWRLVADPGGQRGTGFVQLSRHDIDNVTIRMSRGFPLEGSVEPKDRTESVTVELYPADAPLTMAYFSKSASGGAFRFPAIFPGRYNVNVFATIPGHYLDSVLLGDQDVLGKDVLFAQGAPPLHIVFKPNSAALHGTVENCGGASILVLPDEEALWNFRFIRRATCDSSGHFEMGGLRPGGYRTMALDRIDSSGLDDLWILRQLAAMGKSVRIESGRAAYVELKPLTWPE